MSDVLFVLSLEQRDDISKAAAAIERRVKSMVTSQTFKRIFPSSARTWRSFKRR
jgi:hypothetical protein